MNPIIQNHLRIVKQMAVIGHTLYSRLLQETICRKADLYGYCLICHREDYSPSAPHSQHSERDWPPEHGDSRPRLDFSLEKGV